MFLFADHAAPRSELARMCGCQAVLLSCGAIFLIVHMLFSLQDLVVILISSVYFLGALALKHSVIKRLVYFISRSPVKRGPAATRIVYRAVSSCALDS